MSTGVVIVLVLYALFLIACGRYTINLIVAKGYPRFFGILVAVLSSLLCFGVVGIVFAELLSPSRRLAVERRQRAEAYMSVREPGVDGTTVRGGGQRPVLSVKDLQVYYGNIAAVKGISFDVYQGEIVTLIGANGAGKSTTMRTVSGLIKPRAGEILFEGQLVSGMAGNDVAGLGIAQSPEGRRIFPRMTVLENLELGALQRIDKSNVQHDLERVYDLFPRLKERLGQKGGTLSGGEQQMLAMGRALMAEPRLLLLDEPSMGLAPVLVDVVFEIIERVNSQGTTILLVEQNALAALKIGNYAYVLETGHIGLEGPAAELADNEDVRNAYLGLA
ncbi:MAG TPA: ABC transporter ATP-binding protein [Ilumatobacteraceae bacterium]